MDIWMRLLLGAGAFIVVAFIVLAGLGTPAKDAQRYWAMQEHERRRNRRP